MREFLVFVLKDKQALKGFAAILFAASSMFLVASVAVCTVAEVWLESRLFWMTIAWLNMSMAFGYAIDFYKLDG